MNQPRVPRRQTQGSCLKNGKVRFQKGFFEHGDYLALRDALPDYLKGFVTFAYKTGWRVSEICNLTWNQVDLDQGIVRIEPREAKNDEGRTVYLDAELKEVFACQRESRKKGQRLLPYVFLNRNDTDKIKQFSKTWKRACQDAGIGERLFHDFRRTAIRNMVRAGIPERVAMMVSGHRTRSVFERYNIVNDTDLRLAAQRQEAYLEAQNSYKKVTIHEFQEKGAHRDNG
jgi:integrase